MSSFLDIVFSRLSRNPSNLSKSKFDTKFLTKLTSSFNSSGISLSRSNFSQKFIIDFTKIAFYF